MASAVRARGGWGSEPHSLRARPSHQSFGFVPTVQREGNRPASTFPPETLSMLNLDFQPLLRTSPPHPRPPEPFSEDSLSKVPSPPYLVCSPSSPPLGRPGRYRRRHLGSGRWGRGPRHGAEPLAGRRRGPVPPSLLAPWPVTCTAQRLAKVAEESQTPALPLHLSLLTGFHCSPQGTAAQSPCFSAGRRTSV